MRSSLTFWFAPVVLLAFISPNFGCGDKARIGGGPDINTGIKSALGQYKVEMGYYPKSFQDLVQKPNDATNWHGPYIDPPKVPIDPWGHEYIYEFPGKHNPGSYDLMSAGPDGKKGTENDIGNW